MVLELNIGSVVVIKNMMTGELLTLSVAGGPQSGKQLVAVGTAPGYTVRVVETDGQLNEEPWAPIGVQAQAKPVFAMQSEKPASAAGTIQERAHDAI